MKKSFVVNQQTNYIWKVESIGTVKLDSGVGEYFFAVRVLGANGNFVPGTDFQVRYSFEEDPGNPRKLKVTKNGVWFKTINNGQSLKETERGRVAAGFQLDAGNYTLSMELYVEARADNLADFRVTATPTIQVVL